MTFPHPFKCFIMLSPNIITDFELPINFLGWFPFLLLLLLLWVFFGNSFSGADAIWLSYSFKFVPFGMGRVSLLSTFTTSLWLRFFFGVGIGIVDAICSWFDFCSIFVCFTFSGNTEPFERYTWSRLNACSNKESSVGL